MVCQQAYWRDLPELLKVKSRVQQWVAYYGDQRVAFGRTGAELYRHCLQRGLKRGDFYVGRLEERPTPPWGVLPMERSLFEASDERPAKAPVTPA